MENKILGLHHITAIAGMAKNNLYFCEPGGVLFEIATDNLGFSVDERWDMSGSNLLLPPQHEPPRAEIEAVLPKVD